MLPAEVLTTTCTTAPVPEPVNAVTLTLGNVPVVNPIPLIPASSLTMLNLLAPVAKGPPVANTFPVLTTQVALVCVTCSPCAIVADVVEDKLMLTLFENDTTGFSFWISPLGNSLL